MKVREKEFCRLMAVYADPRRAAREAGYRRPETVLSQLLTREDIAQEIEKLSTNAQKIYRSTVACGLFRLACGDVGDAAELALSDKLGVERLRELDLSCVQEIKRTDKGVELKLCDRIKALDRLAEMIGESSEYGGGLEEAMLRSAQALSGLNERQVTSDEV